MLLNIPNDFVLILTGTQCVGKTTAAYNILKSYPEFRRVSELDIVRTIIRSVIKNLEQEACIDREKLNKHYFSLFKSLSEEDLDIAKQQSELLIPYVREIVNRQQSRKIPTIIEGSSIIPSTYFYNNSPIYGFENNVIFINLYLSNEDEHIERRLKRCIERGYNDTTEMISAKISKIRKNKNYTLHKETLELAEYTNRVFSIDISNKNQQKVVDLIIKTINYSLQ